MICRKLLQPWALYPKFSFKMGRDENLVHFVMKSTAAIFWTRINMKGKNRFFRAGAKGFKFSLSSTFIPFISGAALSTKKHGGHRLKSCFLFANLWLVTTKISYNIEIWNSVPSSPFHKFGWATITWHNQMYCFTKYSWFLNSSYTGYRIILI